jgi:hypothetical protein
MTCTMSKVWLKIFNKPKLDRTKHAETHIPNDSSFWFHVWCAMKHWTVF